MKTLCLKVDVSSAKTNILLDGAITANLRSVIQRHTGIFTLSYAAHHHRPLTLGNAREDENKENIGKNKKIQTYIRCITAWT